MFTKAVPPKPIPPDPAADAIRQLVASIVERTGIRFLTAPDIRLRLDVLVAGNMVGSIDVVLERWPG